VLPGPQPGQRPAHPQRRRDAALGITALVTTRAGKRASWIVTFPEAVALTAILIDLVPPRYAEQARLRGRPALVRPAALRGRASPQECPLVKFFERSGANLDVGGANVRWPVADGVANGAMKPGVATSTWLSVDHIAIWMQVEPGEIGRVVTRPGELLDGHEPIFPRELSIWKRDVTPRGALGSAQHHQSTTKRESTTTIRAHKRRKGTKHAPAGAMMHPQPGAPGNPGPIDRARGTRTPQRTPIPRQKRHPARKSGVVQVSHQSELRGGAG
jgi:hypothetical protein